MSAITPPRISNRITAPLRQVAQRQWTVLAARGLIQTLVISFAVLLAIAIPLGVFENLPIPLRVMLAVTAWATIIVSTFYCLRPALQRWTLGRAAQAADESLPDTHERISSALELSQAPDQFRGSAELVAHLVKQAEQDVARVKATTVIPFSTVFMWAAAFVPVLLLWGVITHFYPAVVGRGLWYTLMPGGRAPGILATIKIDPGEDKEVIEGGSVNIVATVTVFDKKDTKFATLKRAFDKAPGSTADDTDELRLEPRGQGKFGITLSDLPKNRNFRYYALTDRGDKSSSFHVSVVPRPRITGVDVTYEYPKYTGLGVKTFSTADDNIDIRAVVGTKAVVSVHVSSDEPLLPAEAKLVINDGQSDQTLTLTPTSQKDIYTANIALESAAEKDRVRNYHIALATGHKVDGVLPSSKVTGTHLITADPDLPPTITVAAKDMIKVRPDDEVRVGYHATDDFGIAKVEALVSVDDKPDMAIPLVLPSGGNTDIASHWTISITKILKAAGAPDARHLTYQLQATDNRDPLPQTALSQRITIQIDRLEKESYQEKLNEMAKKDLQQAIREAIRQLTVDNASVTRVGDYLTRSRLPDNMVQYVKITGNSVKQTGTTLAAVADEFVDSTFAEIAKRAKSISEHEIAQAAEETLKIATSKDRETAESAHKQIVDAHDKLEKLLEDLQKAADKAEAVQDLKDAAKKQEEVAKQMAEHPENTAENLKKQQEAIAKLQEALQKDPSIQDPKAAEQAKALAELQNQIEKDQQKQTDLQNQTAKQEEQQQAQQQANAIAEEQKKLNEEVQKFAKDDQKALDQAKAQAPDAKQQDQLVKNIEKNQLQQAAQQAQQQADQLKQDAQKLDQQAQNAKADAKPDQQQAQQAKQDKQNQQQADQAQQQADQAAKALNKEAEKPNADAAQQNAQNTEKAAHQIAKQAEKIEQQNQQGAKDPQVQKAAEAAKADAQQAAQEAQQAAQEAKAAAADAKDNNDAQAKPEAAQAQQDAAKAAGELNKAAQELQQAAQAEAKADQAQADAQKAQAQAQQQQNQQAAQQAAEQAKDLAQKQQQIAQALQQQAQQQADAQAAQTPQQTAQQQQQLAQQTQQAQQAAQQLAQQAQANKDANLAQRAQDAAKALDQAAQAQQQAAQADQNNKPADAAQAQADAQQALAKADQALRGAPADPAQADQNQQAAQPDQGQAQQGQPQQGQPQQGQPDQGQAQQTAAQAAAEAAQAQQQALQPNPAAAQEAAQALAQAAQAAEQAQAGQEEQGEHQGEHEGEYPGEHPHQAKDPKLGIASSDTGGDNKVPPTVAALGISASEWAKLPEGVKRELNSVRLQSVAPAYREQTKNYYIRRAQVENDRAKQGR